MNLGHASTAEYQCAEFIDHSILLVGVVVGKILPQSFEEFPLAILLALQAEADQRGDRLAYTHVNRLGIPLHLIGETGDQSDGVSRFDFARMIPSGFLSGAPAT